MARAKKDGEFINCKIRQNVVDRLNQYVEESMISKTNIVERAIEEYLDKVAPKTDDKNTK